MASSLDTNFLLAFRNVFVGVRNVVVQRNHLTPVIQSFFLVRPLCQICLLKEVLQLGLLFDQRELRSGISIS